MLWANVAIQKLKNGEEVKIRPKGNSMIGKINSGDLVTLSPITSDSKIEVGDIVLCKVKGHVYVHLIKAIKDNRFLIGNNCGGINGWTNFNQIYGKVITVES